MIIHLKRDLSQKQVEQLSRQLQALVVHNHERQLLVTTSKLKTLDSQYDEFIDDYFVFDTDIQLANRDYLTPKREITVGDIRFGGNQRNTLVITGPCSIESEEQITQSAELCKALGVKILRAGCFKPRTSPYTFQGLGIEGLKLLAQIRDHYGLRIITEVRDATHVKAVIDYADIIQIGAKSMYDHGILRACGQTQKPVLLKRGFGTTLQEFVQAAEFILSGGNPNVVLCERGIRTFETKTRFTLDLCGVAYLKHHTNRPVVVDPSHAMGYAYGVPDLARAAMAMGVEGLLIESHPNPKVAKSDAAQQLTHEQFRTLYGSLKSLAKALDRTVV